MLMLLFACVARHDASPPEGTASLGDCAPQDSQAGPTETAGSIAEVHPRDPLSVRRGEVPELLAEIVAAEIALVAAGGGFREATIQPRAGAMLDRVAIEWPTAPADWDAIGWRPSRAIRGAYWVELTDVGFTVRGFSDVDNDDVVAEYVATESSPVQRLTPDYVY